MLTNREIHWDMRPTGPPKPTFRHLRKHETIDKGATGVSVQGCLGCNRALELARWVREVKSQVDVEVIDLEVEPDARLGWVIGVPAYMYRDKVFFRVNPSKQDIQRWLDRLDSVV